MPHQLTVNVVSESAMAEDQGVHTAFTQTIAALELQDGIQVFGNRDEPADIVHIHTIGPYSFRQYWRNRKQAKVIISAHVTPDSFVGSLVLARFWAPLARLYLRWFYNLADTVIAVSPPVKKELEAFGVRKPVVFIPNTVDVNRFKPNPKYRAEFRQKLQLKPSDKIIMSAGQIQPRKGIETFIKLAQALPDYHFVWVGGRPFGRLTANYNDITMMMETAPNNVHFTGSVQFEEMAGYYNAGDVFCFPSHQETFGLVAIEAGACGLPLILRDNPLYDEIFGNHFVRATEDTFKIEIERLFNDNQHFQTYQNKALALANQYSLSSIGKQLDSLYRQVLFS